MASQYKQKQCESEHSAVSPRRSNEDQPHEYQTSPREKGSLFMQSHHDSASFNTLKIQSMIEKSTSFQQHGHHKSKRIYFKGEFDINTDESGSQYGKSYCVDFHAVFKKISQACKQKIKGQKGQTIIVSKIQELQQIQQEQKQEEEKSGVMIQEEIKDSPQDTNESQIEREYGNISYPKMIAYSQINYITVNDKINYHIDALNHFKIFTENIGLQYNDENPWCELNFLIYKKFYVQRQKMEKFLKKYPILSPFKFKKSKVTTEEMLKFMKHTGGNLLLHIQSQNKLQKQKIEHIFDQISYIPKKIQSKYYLNVTSFSDNFQSNIFKCLWEYILVMQTNIAQSKAKMKHSSLYTDSLTFGELDKSTAKQIEKQNYNYQKIARAMQIGFMIGELMGKQYTVGIQISQSYISAGMSKSYVKEHRSHFKNMIQDKKIE